MLPTEAVTWTKIFHPFSKFKLIICIFKAQPLDRLFNETNNNLSIAIILGEFGDTVIG